MWRAVLLWAKKPKLSRPGGFFFYNKNTVFVVSTSMGGLVIVSTSVVHSIGGRDCGLYIVLTTTWRNIRQEHINYNYSYIRHSNTYDTHDEDQ